tara:strand:+ start:461 stop:595 length:135 start_codon:yes stop_codon:yes gene_type:complete
MKKKKVIVYPDERGYTLIEEKKPTVKLKDLDMNDLKLWKKDEID